ncbi:MAG: hypothetical protein AAFY08_11070 [Planctomycetota bacterium]
MPDHRRGYVRRGQGVLPSDPQMAGHYRAAQHEPVAIFDRRCQSHLIEAARDTGLHLSADVHAIACEPTHVHVLISWATDRSWKSMRSSVRRAMTVRLNEQIARRTWFSDSPSRKRVRDHKHFDYLVLSYLPTHDGLSWVNGKTRGLALTRDARRERSVVERARHGA